MAPAPLEAPDKHLRLLTADFFRINKNPRSKATSPISSCRAPRPLTYGTDIEWHYDIFSDAKPYHYSTRSGHKEQATTTAPPPPTTNASNPASWRVFRMASI